MAEMIDMIRHVAQGGEGQAEPVQQNNFQVRPEGTSEDIKLSWAPGKPDIIVDMLAYKITPDENNAERMNVSYQTSKGTIHNATKEQMEAAREHLKNLVENSFQGAGVAGVAQIKEQLADDATRQMDQLFEQASVEEVKDDGSAAQQ